MMQNQIYYKTAFKVTRKASHTRTFRTIQSVFGDDALRIVMSESYWLVHGSLNGLTSFIRDEAQERNLTISNASADREKIRARLEKAYNTSIDPGERLAEAFADSSTEEKIHCSKTVITENYENRFEALNTIRRVVEDGAVSISEVTKLSDEIQLGLIDCLGPD